MKAHGFDSLKCCRKDLTICPARCQAYLLFIYPKPVSALAGAPIRECCIFLSCHVPTITNSYVKCISEGAIECAWGSLSEWQKAYKRNEENAADFDRPVQMCVSELFQAVPLSPRGDNTSLFFQKLVKIIAVNSSAIFIPCVKPGSFGCLLLKCFCLLSQISNYCSYCCFKHLKLSLGMGLFEWLLLRDFDGTSVFIWVAPHKEQNLSQYCLVRLDWNTICAAQYQPCWIKSAVKVWYTLHFIVLTAVGMNILNVCSLFSVFFLYKRCVWGGVMLIQCSVLR